MITVLADGDVIPEPISSTRAQFLEDPTTIDCRPAAEGDWLYFAEKPPGPSEPQHSEVATAVALAKLTGAVSAVGLMSRAAHEMIAQVVINLPSEGSQTRPSLSSASVFDPDLGSFSFSYTSHFPLQSAAVIPPSLGLGPESGGQGTNGVATRNRGSGELRVDLLNRRMYFRGVAANISAGLPEVESRVFFRGDRGRMYVYTRAGDFEQCWNLNSADAVPGNPGDRYPNPFRRGKKAADRVWVPEPGGPGALDDKYVFTLESLQKRVQLFVNSESALTAINVDSNKGCSY